MQRHADGNHDIADLLAAARKKSSGEKVLFEVMTNLMDYTNGQSPTAEADRQPR